MVFLQIKAISFYDCDVSDSCEKGFVSRQCWWFRSREQANSLPPRLIDSAHYKVILLNSFIKQPISGGCLNNVPKQILWRGMSWLQGMFRTPTYRMNEYAARSKHLSSYFHPLARIAPGFCENDVSVLDVYISYFFESICQWACFE